MSGGCEDAHTYHQSLMRRVADAADDAAFREFYARVGRAIYRHHEQTGIELKPGLWKIYVGQDMADALTIYAHRLRKSSTALELNQVVDGSVMRLGGFDIRVDPNLTGDLIQLRTETWA